MGYDVEHLDIGFNGKSLGLQFIQTVHAPEDVVVIHPKQVAKLLQNISIDGIIDIRKS